MVLTWGLESSMSNEPNKNWVAGWFLLPASEFNSHNFHGGGVWGGAEVGGEPPYSRDRAHALTKSAVSLTKVMFSGLWMWPKSAQSQWMSNYFPEINGTKILLFSNSKWMRKQVTIASRTTIWESYEYPALVKSQHRKKVEGKKEK